MIDYIIFEEMENKWERGKYNQQGHNKLLKWVGIYSWNIFCFLLFFYSGLELLFTITLFSILYCFLIFFKFSYKSQR